MEQVAWGDRYLRDRSLKARDDIPYPNWPQLLGDDLQEWQSTLQDMRSDVNPNVLIATSMGGFAGGASVESLLTVALGLRGVKPHVMLCDKALPACQLSEVGMYPRVGYFAQNGPSTDLCHHCLDPAERMYADLGVPIHRYSDNLTEAERALAREVARDVDLASVARFTHDQLRIGEHALAGALRFFARATIVDQPFAEQVVRRYVEAAMLTALATQSVLRRHTFASVVLNHGIYVPQGLILDVCRREALRVVTWNPAYRKKCFIFSHGDTYHHTLMTESVSTWETMRWGSAQEEEIQAYLSSRAEGTNDWIWFHDDPVGDINTIEQSLGIDLSKPTVGLLTNVMWDAQLHYPNNAFPNMLAWVLETIAYFEGRPDLQLIIRVHPAEIRGAVKSRQPIVEEVRSRYPLLPPNVWLVGPEDRASTYALMARCNAVAIYGTKTGVELTSAGIPVIVAGEAWIRNKGITLDAQSREEYFQLLNRLPLRHRMNPDDVRRAQMYAYHFFLRRMIPVEQLVPTGGNPPYQIQLSGLDDLRPNGTTGLDTICDGILTGSDFIYPAEILGGGLKAVSTRNSDENCKSPRVFGPSSGSI